MAKKIVKPENPTLQDVCDGYLASFARDGCTNGTTASYINDLKVATKYLGAETPVRDLTVDRVRGFFDATVVTTKRNGTPKNPISVAKTRRILRLALVWAANAGWIEVAPIPPKEKGCNARPATTVDEPTDPPLDLAGFDHPTMTDVTPEEIKVKNARRTKKTKAVAG